MSNLRKNRSAPTLREQIQALEQENAELQRQLADAEEPGADLEYSQRVTTERDELQRRIDAALALHQPTASVSIDVQYCQQCGVRWPCPNQAALTAALARPEPATPDGAE